MKQETKQKIKIYSIYTAIFIVLALIIFSIFIIQGKSFIWTEDGYDQHFLILYNFNETIRNSFENGISTFLWNLDLGIDVIGQFSYYILGDPFAYITLLFPMNKLEFVYGLLILVRMYLIGISFLTYCRYHKKATFNSILGAIIYTFSGFVVYAGLRHPFFLNAVMMFPLVLLGIDKIYKENKAILFMVVIAIIAIMNYYFLYIITILTVIYAIIKYFCEYKEEGYKFFVKKFIKALVAYIIAILIAGIIMLPTIYAFINSNRLSDVRSTSYKLNYYAILFTAITSNNSLYWARICVSSLVLIMLPISFYNLKNKENKTVLMCIIVETIMLLFRCFGSLMNGLSFQSNRWVFGYVFLLSYMVVLHFRQDLKYSKKELKTIIIMLIIYLIGLVVCNIHMIANTSLVSTIFAGMMVVTIILNNKYVKIKKISKYIILFLVVANISYYGIDLYIKTGKGYITEFIDANMVVDNYNNYKGKIKNYDKAIDKIKREDSSFYRISNNIYTNANMALIHKYNSLNGYLSVGNKYIGQLAKDVNNSTYNSATNPLRQLDGRTKITTLLANKYFIVRKGKSAYVPYGYEKYQDIEDNTSIYINRNNLPIAVFYKNYILKEDYEKLSSLEKEQAILETAVVDKKLENIEYNENAIENIKNKTAYEVEYKIKNKNKILKNKEIKIKKEKQSITLDVSKAENCELYIQFTGLKYQSSAKYNIQIKYKDIRKIKRIRDTQEDPYYINNDTILVNLGYREEHEGKIKISFSEKGKYKFDSIKIIAVPMNVYDESIRQLRETQFNLEKYENGLVEGNIVNKESGILQISTPYTKGWTAYIDNEKTEIMNVNVGFIGIPINSGEHKITLKYETPYLKEGIILSVIGVMLAIGFIIIEKKFCNGQV